MCKLLELAKENAKLESYYAVGKAIGASKELVSRWKNGKQQPNGYYTLKLCELGNINTKDAIRLFEGGFVEVSLLLVTALGGMGLSCLIRYADSLYIMLNEQLKLMKSRQASFARF